MPFLLHFTKKDTLKKIIENGLRLGTMTNTNDIFERSDLISDMHKVNGTFVDRDIVFKANFRCFYKLVCFSLVEDFKISDIKAFINMPTMWAHYGEQFNGACLILDKDKFEESLNIHFDTSKFFHRKISYDLPLHVIEKFYHGHINKESDYYKLTISDLRKNFIKNISNNLDLAFQNKNHEEIKKIYKESEVLFYKHPEWEKENEYRYIFEIGIDNDIYISIENSIEGMIFSNIEKDEDDFTYINKLDKIYQDKSFLMQWEHGFPDICSFNASKNLRDELTKIFEKE